MYYSIGSEDGRLHDAKIEVDGQSVILHSRGGSTGGRPARNTGYALALLAICHRAMIARDGLKRVLIDSAPARRRPDSERVLIDDTEIPLLDADELAREIRVRMRKFGQAKGTTGGNATKQIRFDFGLSSAEIVNLLALKREGSARDSARQPIEPLDAATQRRVTVLHIRQAVDQMLAENDSLGFTNSHDYDLLGTGGVRLAPGQVFAIALGAALGIKVHPGQFKLGWHEPSFQLLTAAGYRIVPKVTDSDEIQVPSEGKNIPPDPDEKDWAEGDVKLRRHLRTERRRDPAAAAAKRSAVRALHGGRLVCENPVCDVDWYDIFPVAVAESVFEIHHSIPVSKMAADHRTTISELACLCASCHRAEHRRMSLAGFSEPES